MRTLAVLLVTVALLAMSAMVVSADSKPMLEIQSAGPVQK